MSGLPQNGFDGIDDRRVLGNGRQSGFGDPVAGDGVLAGGGVFQGGGIRALTCHPLDGSPQIRGLPRGDDVADDEEAVRSVIGDLLVGQGAGHSGLAM